MLTSVTLTLSYEFWFQHFEYLGVYLFFINLIGVYFGMWLSKKANLSNRLGMLIGAGTSICGVTAIMALGIKIIHYFSRKYMRYYLFLSNMLC